MKLAFFNHSLRLGSGIDMVITELASRLVNRKVDITVFCFKTSYKKDEYNFEIREIKSSLANTPAKMALLAPFLIDKTGDFIPGLEKYDVVNTHNFPANYIVRNIKKPLNVVTDWSVGESKLWPSSLKQRLYVKWLVYRGNGISARNADAVLVSSEFIRNWVKMNYAIDPYYMMLNGINFELLDRKKVSPSRVYQLYPEIEGKKVILFVGRMTDHKNVHSLIEAFAMVRKRDSDVILLLVGDYDNYMGYYRELKQLVRNRHVEDNVIFTGVVPSDDLPSYYAASSIYATCTQWEGFLRAEYYAFAKPIVCFDTGPNAETVRNRENGFLVRDLNIIDFAEKMHTLLTDTELAKQMGENGYSWAKKVLDFNLISEEFKTFCEHRMAAR